MSKKILRNKTQNYLTTVKCSKYMFDLVASYKEGRMYIFFSAVMSFLGIVFTVLYTIFPGMIINELTSDKRIEHLAVYTVILCSAPLIHQLLKSLLERKLTKLRIYIEMQLKVCFYEVLADIPYELLESPNIQQNRHRAAQTLNGALNIVGQMSEFITSTIGFLAMSAIVMHLNPIVLILIFVFLILNSIVTKRTNQKIYKMGDDMMDIFAHEESIAWIFEKKEYAKEVRMFELKNFLIKKFKENAVRSIPYEIKEYDIRSFSSLFSSATAFIQQIVVYGYVIFKVIFNGLPVGNLTIYMSAVGQVSGSLNRIFNSYLDLSRRSLEIQDMMEFMSLPQNNILGNAKLPVINKKCSIEFRDVCFHYPDSDINVIDHMNLTINLNEKICIVGENGCGKSTFIKLLARLYEPSQGMILLNGIDIREFDITQYRRLFAPAFQDFCKYDMSISENIAFGQSNNTDKIQEVCDFCKLNDLVDKLPKGVDTQVGKYIDEEGFEPSGGEGQKIAIARALFRQGYISA